MCGIGAATAERYAFDRGDRGQRHALKAVAVYGFEVAEAGDLAGRMPRQRQRQFLLRNAAAVVGDAQEAHAAFFQMDVDTGGTGIETVFEDLLEHRGRAFNHLACGNLADEEVRQRANDGAYGHERIISAASLSP